MFATTNSYTLYAHQFIKQARKFQHPSTPHKCSNSGSPSNQVISSPLLARQHYALHHHPQAKQFDIHAPPSVQVLKVQATKSSFPQLASGGASTTSLLLPADAPPPFGAWQSARGP
eukprot:1160640-Pelagomonas_calceolata.AAC.5